MFTRQLRKASSASADTAITIYQDAIKKLKICIGKSGTTAQKHFQKKLSLAYRELGMVYFHDLKYKEALNYFNSALDVARKSGLTMEIAENLFNVAELCMEQSRYSEAMEKYGESLEEYKKINDGGGIFWCYTGMGIVQKQTGNFSDAIRCYNRALEIAKSSGLKKEEASCYNNLGNVYRKKGDFANAMQSYEKAITHFQSLKEDISASDCMNNIGNLYLDYGDPFRALDYYNRSLRIVKVNNDQYRLIIRYKNLAGAYLDLKDYDNAYQFLEKAIMLAEKSGDKSFLASCFMLSGKLHAAKNNSDLALAFYNKAMFLNREIGARVEEAEALIEIAIIELQESKTNEAIAHAQLADKLADEAGSLKIQVDANLCLSKCYEKKGDAKKALQMLAKSMQLKDSIYSVEKHRTIEGIQAGFAQRELKKENETLAQNSQLQSQALRNRNIMVILLGICLILSAALIWLIYKRQRESKKESSRVQQISEEKIEKLNEDLVSKERELTSKTIFINQKNQLLEKLIKDLEELKQSGGVAAAIHGLQNTLKQELSPNNWKEFEIQFNEVHPGFQNRLLEQFPELSPAERRLCSFIRLDMNTREISSLTGQSTKSIEVARTRIRKKLNVPHEHNLTNFIAKL